jgi:hypothetical protein
MIDTDCTGSWKCSWISNYHTITTTTAPGTEWKSYRQTNVNQNDVLAGHNFIEISYEIMWMSVKKCPCKNIQWRDFIDCSMKKISSWKGDKSDLLWRIFHGFTYINKASSQHYCGYKFDYYLCIWTISPLNLILYFKANKKWRMLRWTNWDLTYEIKCLSS